MIGAPLLPTLQVRPQQESFCRVSLPPTEGDRVWLRSRGSVTLWSENGALWAHSLHGALWAHSLPERLRVRLPYREARRRMWAEERCCAACSARSPCWAQHLCLRPAAEVSPGPSPHQELASQGPRWGLCTRCPVSWETRLSTEENT